MADVARVAAEAPEVPDRLFFRIGDVSKLTGVETYVLRFWESKFPTLAPRKMSNGQRQYRRKDIFTVFEIKSLLYDKKYTIPGARKALGNRAGKRPQAPSAAQPIEAFASGPKIAGLADIKQELREILDILEG